MVRISGSHPEGPGSIPGMGKYFLPLCNNAKSIKNYCRNPGSNQGPLDLQSNALPTELFRPTIDRGPAHDQYRIHVAMINNTFTPEQHKVRTSNKCVSIGGSVVECSPATRAARVRFPADATFD